MAPTTQSDPNQSSSPSAAGIGNGAHAGGAASAVSASSPASSVSAGASPPTAAKATGGTIDVTSKAVDAIRRQLLKRGTPESALRLGIRGGGCSGFSYVIEFHDGAPHARDRVFTFGDVRVVVDPKSLIYLNGAVLEWEQTLMRQGFKFLNPQEKTNCGCGHSFTV